MDSVEVVAKIDDDHDEVTLLGARFTRRYEDVTTLAASTMGITAPW